MIDSRPARVLLLVVLLALAALGALSLFGVTPFASSRNSARTPGVPETEYAYAISDILVQRREGRQRMEAIDRIDGVRSRLERGESFAELARRVSEDEASRDEGGFLGFTNVNDEKRFSGAVQALPPGTLSAPVETENGIHLIYRHTYEEARKIERDSKVAAYGFFVASREAPQGGPDRSMAEARARAEEALEKIKAGGASLLDVRRAYGEGEEKNKNVFIGLIGRGPHARWLYEPLAKAPVNGPMSIVEGAGVYAVVRRGQVLRSVVRHILVAHADSMAQELRVRTNRSKADAKARAEKARSELKADGSNWTHVLTQYTDETETVPMKGSLGVVGNGMLTAEMEDAILEARPGQISSTVAESPAGYHVLWRVD